MSWDGMDGGRKIRSNCVNFSDAKDIMSEFLKAYPHARQVTLDKVIESWLETGGSGASKKKSDVKAPTPSTAQERYEQMTKEGGSF